jgi:hypothetical protein
LSRAVLLRQNLTGPIHPAEKFPNNVDELEAVKLVNATTSITVLSPLRQTVASLM